MVTRARPVNLFVGGLILMAMPGVAFAAVPATAPAPAPSPAMPPPAATVVSPPGAPQPYAPPPAPGPQGYPPPSVYPAYPPPPPGYYYPPPAYGPPGAPPAYFTAQRLAIVEADIRDLTARRDDISFGSPVVLIVGGAAAFVVGVALVSYRSCSSYATQSQFDSCYQDNNDDEAIGSLLILSGAAGVTIGTIQAIIRGAKRRHLARQIVTRQSEAAALRGLHPTWGVAPARGGGGALTLAFDF